MIKRVISFAAALGAIFAGAGALMVAIAFALYALLKDYVGPAGASALTALLLAILIGVVAVVALGQAKGKPKAHAKADKGGGPPAIVQRGLDLARERPLLAAGAAVAAGLLALRNPALIGAVIGAVSARGERR